MKTCYSMPSKLIEGSVKKLLQGMVASLPAENHVSFEM
jgi:hypothetical protein